MNKQTYTPMCGLTKREVIALHVLQALWTSSQTPASILKSAGMDVIKYKNNMDAFAAMSLIQADVLLNQIKGGK